MTTLAFTSCSDPLDAPTQPVWDAIADAKPDHLVLLGDQIYMDYSILGVGTHNPGIGKPAKYDNLKFATEMHRRYAAQWQIMMNSRLLKLPGLQIHGIWDDHDFAWNNSFGNAGSNDTHGPGTHADPVPCDKQRIARRLMRDFFEALATRAASYPANPVQSDGLLPQEDLSRPMVCSGTRHTPAIDVAPGVRLLLTDGRSFRTARGVPGATALGQAQWAWIASQLAPGQVTLLTNGTTLTQGAEQLAHFDDYTRLLALAAQQQARILCLTGDVHDIAWHHHNSRVYEAVASGAARPTAGLEGAFGLLQISEASVAVRLVANDKHPIERVLDRATWVAQP